jgi:ATP-binding cassette subfamily B protein
MSGAQPPAPPRSGGVARRAVAAGLLTAKAAPAALALFVILTLAGGSLPVIAAWLTKLVLDGLMSGVPLARLIWLAGCLALAGICTGVIPQLTRYLQAELERAAGLLAHDRVSRAVGGFPGLRRFEDPRFLDRLRLAQQAGGISPNQAVEGMLGATRAAITIGGFLGSLFLLNPVLTTLVLLAGVPTMAAQLSLARRRARMFWEVGPAERREFFHRELLSGIEAAKEVRLFGLEAFLRERMLGDRRSTDAAKRAIDRREFVIQATSGLTAAAVSGVGLLWAVHAAQQGRLSVGDITILIAAIAGVQGALAILASEFARTHQALLMFDHYLAVVTAGPDLPVSAAPRALLPLRTGIELRDVWFRYSDDHPWVLRGINLHIPCGSSLSLVGLNGSGKSTLVKLLCRFYDPVRGAILWDGVDIRDIAVAELRQRIGAVFQDYMQYDMTASENVALGDLTAGGDRTRIEDAARRAGIHATVAALPNGYGTMLSRKFFGEPDQDDPETGVVLSEGQWQRLALARALLRDRRDLMILDEPSAGLDAEAEAEIHAALRQHRRGQTSLLISHRLGAVRDANLIVVLAGGQVVEQGDHATLLTGGGEYARLFTLQAAGYQTQTTDGLTLTGER